MWCADIKELPETGGRRLWVDPKVFKIRSIDCWKIWQSLNPASWAWTWFACDQLERSAVGWGDTKVIQLYPRTGLFSLFWKKVTPDIQEWWPKLATQQLYPTRGLYSLFWKNIARGTTDNFLDFQKIFWFLEKNSDFRKIFGLMKHFWKLFTFSENFQVLGNFRKNFLVSWIVENCQIFSKILEFCLWHCF